LATPKPQLLRARAQEGKTFVDSLKLLPSLRAGLRAASLPVVRGAQQQEPALVYLDSVVDEMPDALIPQVLYDSGQGTIIFSIRLLRGNTLVVERTIELAAGPVLSEASVQSRWSSAKSTQRGSESSAMAVSSFSRSASMRR
jgi:hypothetical protein